MEKKTKIPDHGALIPFVLFGILAAIVTFCIIKGTYHKKTVQMEEDVLYIKPQPKL